MKEGEQQKDGKGKEVVDEEGVSSVRTEGSGGSGSGGSRPGFGGRMPKLPTLVSKHDFKVRAKEEVDTYGGFESFGVVEDVCCDISVLDPGSP